jgi:PPOX class probable F420-dependent enzyme
MSRRDQIRMSEDEVRKFVRESKTIILCSNGPTGVPHPMPMWFQVDDDFCIKITTYARSQKVRNLRRDPRVSLLVESGEEYAELKGAVLYGKAEIIEDVDRVIETLMTASGRADGADPEQAEAMRQAMRAQAAKRVLIEVRPDHIVSWDHSRLGGVY